MSTTKKVVILLGGTALAAVLAVLSVSSVSMIQGQGTDVGYGVNLDLPTDSLNPEEAAPEASAPSAPPATNLPPAPIEQPTAGEAQVPVSGEAPTSAGAPAATELPSAGSGGMLDQDGGVQSWLILMVIGAAVLTGVGGLASLRSHKS